MGVATGTLIVAGVAAAVGGAKAIKSGADKKKHRNAIANYERQDLNNPAQDMRISTLGADIQREQNSQMQSNVVNAIQMGGSRAIIGATGRAAAASNNVSQGIANSMDNQMLNRERAIIQGQQNIQQMQERREEEDLRGLGAQYAKADQDMWQGIDQVAGAGMMAASGISGTIGGDGGQGGGGGFQGMDVNNGQLAQATKFDPNYFNSGYNDPNQAGMYGIYNNDKTRNA